MRGPAGRKERREFQRRMMKRPPELTEAPPDRWPSGYQKNDRFAVYESDKYLVQLFNEKNGVVRISVNRAELRPDGQWRDDISWDELQNIKQQVGYADKYAVEVFPSRMDEVNVANMRHLWVLPEPLDVGWFRFDLKETFSPRCLPNDMDEFLSQAEQDGWVFLRGSWEKEGFKSRATQQLYDYIINR